MRKSILVTATILFLALCPPIRATDDDPLPVLRLRGTVKNVITVRTQATALVGGGGFTATYLDLEQRRSGATIVQRVRCSGSPGPSACDALAVGDRVLVRATYGSSGLGLDAAHPILFDVLDITPQ